MDIELLKNSIIITKDKTKDSLVKYISNQDEIINTKIITLTELLKKYYFDYDNKTIYYVSKKYNVIKEVATIYINNLYYINKVVDEKTKFLYELKQDLLNNKLLKENKLFKSFLSNKKIILYNLDYVDNFYNNIFNELEKTNNIIRFKTNSETSKKQIYKAKNKEEEIVFVANCIVKLIKKGININKIKLANISKEYSFTIKKIFNLFNIPIELDNENKAKSTIIVKKFKELYNEDINITLTNLKEDIKNSNDEYIYKKILDIVNSYAWIDNYLDVKEFIFKEIDNIKLKKIKYDNSVKVIDFLNDSINDDEYIYLLNYNLGKMPTISKNEDYLDDTTKIKLGLSTSSNLNKNSIKEVQNKIKVTKNLIVTYSAFDEKNELYISNAYNKEDFIISNIENDYTNSDKYNIIKLISALDENKKYNIINEELKLLNKHYNNLEYESYNNKYKTIDKDKLNKYLDNKLTLSYTSIDDYYKCSFRYYLDYILKINKYEDTFQIVIGNIFHKILSECFKDNYDIEYNYNKQIEESNYKFNNMEKYFINRLKEELILVINTIKEQLSYTKLTKSLYEKKVVVKVSNNTNIIFKGFIDKILYDEINNTKIVAIIDYKTGNPELNLNNLPYGIEMQLPVYIYLVKNEYKDVKIGGFYLQKILNTSSNIDERIEGLKLQGYTNEDINIVSNVDTSYNDSKIIKGLKTSSNGFYSYSKVLSDKKIDKIYEIVSTKIKEASTNILDAKFDINPKEIDNELIGCKYCKYKDICYRKNDDIKKLKKLNYKEFLEGDNDAKMD